MGVNNGHCKQLFAICSINIASVSVSLFLKIVLHFKKHRLARSEGNILNYRGEKSRMQDQNLELFK